MAKVPVKLAKAGMGAIAIEWRIMAENGVISAKQAKAVAALLAANTLGEASKICGLSVRTLSRYLDDPGFSGQLAAAETRIMAQATRRLTALSTLAVDTLEATMRDPEALPGVKLRAAGLALDLLPKLRDQIEVERRLSALEEIINAHA